MAEPVQNSKVVDPSEASVVEEMPEATYSDVIPSIEVKKGIGVVTTAFFIVAEMAGSGVLALPKAVVESGYSGIALILVASVMSAYTGKILGDMILVIYASFVS